MKKHLNLFLSLLFGIGIVVFLYFGLGNEEFQMWAFTRHQNPLSWYIRPLFLIPFCFFAYQKSWAGILGTVLALLTSMFWFDPPSSLDPQAQAFLDMELAYLTRKWDLTTILMSLLVPLSLGLLGYAFWKRNLWFGLAVMALMMVTKLIWSFLYGGETGNTVVLPAVLGLIVCVALVVFGFRKMEQGI